MAPAGSGVEHAPAVSFLGPVKASSGAPFTAADTNGDDIALLSPATAKKPCHVFRWTLGSATFASTVTATYPAKDAITCKATEGLAFTRDPNDAAVFARDLVIISDTSTGVLRYWYLPAS